MKTAAELLANWNKEHERGAKWSEWLDDVRCETDFMLSSRALPLSERMRHAAELKRATANAMIVCASWAMEREGK